MQVPRLLLMSGWGFQLCWGATLLGGLRPVVDIER